MKLLGKIFLAIAVLTTMSVTCFADNYPSKPIKLFVPYGAGGSTDMVTRKIASIAEKKLGVPIVVENKPGATGTLAIRELMKLKPDGYHLSMVDTSATSRTPHIINVPYDAQKDLPISASWFFMPAASSFRWRSPGTAWRRSSIMPRKIRARLCMLFRVRWKQVTWPCPMWG